MTTRRSTPPARVGGNPSRAGSRWPGGSAPCTSSTGSSRAAGSPDLPVGNCLVIETILIPTAMVAVDGLLLAWLLAALRNAGLDAFGEGRFNPGEAVALMPAAMLGCLAAVPARYLAAFVLLANDHLPTSVQTTPLGSYIRWQLGDWGLADVQAIALIAIGIVGIIPWTRGRLVEAIVGYGRLLAADGGHLVATLLMTAVATGLLAAPAYAIVLLLPAQSWVLNAADSYSHYATIPVGIWTLAALIELGQRSLPMAQPLRTSSATIANGESDRAHPDVHDHRPPVAAPSS